MYKFVDQLSYFSYVILYLFVYKIYVSNCFVYFSLAHLLQALQNIPTALAVVRSQPWIFFAVFESLNIAPFSVLVRSMLLQAAQSVSN